MSEETKYYQQTLWNYYDKQMTQNTFAVISTFSKDKYGISPTSLQFAINNFKQRSFNQVMLSHKEIFLLLLKFKPISDNLSKYQKEIEADHSIVKTIRINTKKNLTISMIYKMEYDNGICFKLLISDQDEKALDNASVFVDVHGFLSLIKILVNYRDSYITLASSSQQIVHMDEISKIVENLNSTVNRMYGLLLTSNKQEDHLEGLPAVEDKEVEMLGKEFNAFLDSNRDDMVIDKLDIPDIKKTVEVSESIFTEKFLNNDLTNLETILNNLVLEHTPLETFINLLFSRLEIEQKDFTTLFPGCSSQDYWMTVYATTRYMKHFIHDHLTKQVGIPTSVVPIVLDVNQPTPLNLSVMHDLLLYIIYFTLLRNQIKSHDQNVNNNKSLICFVLKSVLSPLVFSFFKHTSNKEVLMSEISGRYERYKEMGVFKELESQVMKIQGNSVDITPTAITDAIDKLYTNVITNSQKFSLNQFFNDFHQKKVLLFDFDKFSKYTFSEEQITKILILESQSDNGVISDTEVKDVSDLPEEIISKFGLQEKKFDTRNLRRFVEQDMKDNKYLSYAIQIIECINTSFRDLKSKTFDYNCLTDNVLKLLCLWDLEVDHKLSVNYNYLEEQVKNSSIERNSATSMLSNITDNKEVDFSNSLNIADLNI